MRGPAFIRGQASIIILFQHYLQWRRQDFSLGAASRRRGGEAPRGVGCGEGVSLSPPGEGAVPPPQKIFDYLILKWRILMHISGILTYLFLKFCLQRKAEYMYMK